MEPQYFVIYKPYLMISQFVSPYQQRLLGDINFNFPPGTNAVGRLDNHSEGLLILTTDKSLTRRLLHPSKQHYRTYAVLVRGKVTEEDLTVIRTGVNIGNKGKGYHTTLPCEVKIISGAQFAEREPPYIQYGEHTWLEFKLTEGKNRQIRKMCKEIKHHVQRLIRTHIEDLGIDTLQPGEVRCYEKEEIEKLLHLTDA